MGIRDGPPKVLVATHRPPGSPWSLTVSACDRRSRSPASSWPLRRQRRALTTGAGSSALERRARFPTPPRRRPGPSTRARCDPCDPALPPPSLAGGASAPRRLLLREQSPTRSGRAKASTEVWDALLLPARGSRSVRSPPDVGRLRRCAPNPRTSCSTPSSPVQRAPSAALRRRAGAGLRRSALIRDTVTARIPEHQPSEFASGTRATERRVRAPPDRAHARAARTRIGGSRRGATIPG